MIVLFLVVCAQVCVSAITAKEIKENPYIVIKPLTHEQRAPVVAYLKKNKHTLEEADGFCWLSDSIDAADCYFCDINNDLIEEYVFVTREGSLALPCFYAFIKKNNEFTPVTLPDEIQQIGWPFHHPITKKEELFVQAQGTIYLCGSTDGDRTIYCVGNNGCKKVDNLYWIHQQRELFNTLTAIGAYAPACELVQPCIDNWYHYDETVALWAENDLAFATLKDDRPATALSILTQLKHRPVTIKRSMNLSKAIEHNETLCKNAIAKDAEKGSRRAYSFDWLRAYEKDRTRLTSDKEFENLFRATVADIKELNRGHIAQHFYGPLDDTVTITDNRYASFSGFYPHVAFLVGFMWCDLQEQVSVVVTGEKKGFAGDEPLIITSRSLQCHELPDAFFSACYCWIKEYNVNDTQIIFYDRFGALSLLKNTKIDSKILSTAPQK